MSLLKITWDFPDFAKRMQEAMPEIMNVAAASIQTNRGMLFDREGAYNGHDKWKDLVLRQGMILSNRGALRQSIGPFNDGKNPVRARDGVVEILGERVTIGTTIAYAKILNDGGVIRPVTAKALKIPLPAGKNATDFAKSLRKTASKHKIFEQIDAARKAYRKTKSLPHKEEILQRLIRLTDKIQNLKRNDRFIFRKKVTIPARNFTDWNSQDRDELRVTLRDFIKKRVFDGRKD